MNFEQISQWLKSQLSDEASMDEQEFNTMVIQAQNAIQAHSHAMLAVTSDRPIDDATKHAYLVFTLADHLIAKGELSKSQQIIEKAISNNSADSYSQNDLLYLKTIQGRILKEQGKHDLAQQIWLVTVKEAEDIQNDERIFQLYDNLGTTTENPIRQFGYFEAALESARKIGEPKSLCLLYNNMATAILKKSSAFPKEKIDNVKIYLDDALSIARSLQDEMIVLTLKTVGNFELDSGNLLEAEKRFIEARDLNRELANARLGRDIHTCLAEVLIGLKRFSEAEDILYDLIDSSDKSNDVGLFTILSGLLGDLGEKRLIYADTDNLKEELWDHFTSTEFTEQTRSLTSKYEKSEILAQAVRIYFVRARIAADKGDVTKARDYTEEAIRFMRQWQLDL